MARGGFDLELNVNCWVCGNSDIAGAKRRTESMLNMRIVSLERTARLSKEQIEEHKKYMDDYRSVVESSWHPLTMSGHQDMLSPKAPDTASPAGIAAAGLPNSLSPAPRTALEVQMGVVSPQLGPADLPDVNAQALGQTRPTSILPMDGPTRVAPPSPNFAAPKRSFY